MAYLLRSAGVCLLLMSAAIAQTTSPTQRSSTTSPSFTLPAGTAIDVRMNETLASNTSTDGDRFTGTTSADITDANGRVVIPRGAEVNGRVITAKPSGRLSDAGTLELTINTIRSNGRVINLSTEPFVIQGKSHTKSNTTKIGGGAALGAIIGAIAGGGKGAAIGAGVGAAAGTGAAAATGKQEASVEAEAVLKFVTATEARVTSASPAQQRTPAQSEDKEPVLQRRENTTAASATNPAASGAENTAPRNVWAEDKADFYAFSLRDKRVLNNCLATNPATTNAVAAVPINKGTTLNAALQKSVRSLPLACDRELPALPNELERVIHGKQVLLLDPEGKVLDVLDLR
jgi:hypothetical protein